MGIRIPDFDFGSYDPHNPWAFPAQRLVRFAAEAYEMAAHSRAAWTKVHPHPDLRSVVFHELAALAHGLLLGAMHLRSHGEDADWWQAQHEIDHRVTGQLMRSNNQNLRNLLQLGYLEGVLRQLTLAVRQYGTAVAGAGAEVSSLRQAWRGLLAATSLEEYKPLLSLLQLQRDVIGQHGRYLSGEGSPLAITFRGRRILLQAGQEMRYQDWGFVDDWDFILFLVVQCDGLLDALNRSEALRAVAFVPTGYLG